jgi:hypothetical protein
MKLWIVFALVLVLATSAMAYEKKAYQMREDYGTEPMYNCALQYYYYIPCPTYSWFWSFTGWAVGDVVGEVFLIGDHSTGGWPDADPYMCHTLEQIRVLDFAGYGTVYPGMFTVEFCVWCADPTDNNPVRNLDPPPTYLPLWCSEPYETHYGWNYVLTNPPDGVCLTPCCLEPGPPPGYPFILVTAKCIGTAGVYPAWGFDNICTPIGTGCIMHDLGCLPALYPRPYVSHYSYIHSGYYGTCYDFEYCPPLWFCDGCDTTPDCSQFGFIELAWRIYLIASGPTPTEPSSWGNIKAMYK